MPLLAASCCLALGACSESVRVLDARPSRDAGSAGSAGSTTLGRDAGSSPIDNAQSRPDAGPQSDAALMTNDYLLTPDMPTLALEHGSGDGSLQFEVRNGAGGHVDSRFDLDDDALGSIDASGKFVASGKRAGTTWVEAQVGGRVLRTQLTVTIRWTQNGALADPASAQASGGYGGVGGEGPGGALGDDQRAALDKAPKADASLQFLYPYDRTVFPLGLLSPLLMWSEASFGAAEGLRVQISADKFEYRGYFGRPAPLAANAPFVRHPIPQDVWETATRSAAGGGAKVQITLLKAGVAYGPIAIDLKIAAGTLKGTVYYQSYGTNLAKNYGGAKGGDGRFGGATLAIKPGALGPELVAGSDGNEKQCRVCHSVSSDGSRMTVQQGEEGYPITSSYDLKNGNTEQEYTGVRKQLAWIGLTPDGALGLGNGMALGVSEMATQLYDMSNGQVVTSNGLDGFVTEAAFPMFSHDGKRVAFNFFAGPGNMLTGPADQKKLVAMDFDRATRTFANPVLLYQGDKPAGWPTFSPTGNSVIYELEVKRGSDNRFFYSRYGGQGELWWTRFDNGQAHKLEQANGTRMGASYLPRAGDNHGSDELLNYEPTLAPVASGGYAWMVFTSRRAYGNVATIDPWFSDPRDHDLTRTPTTKKLWVAAIELDILSPEFDIRVGDDPSHPGFYLPGQELLAGNTRGFWAIDPCKADGNACESGVECCTGFCQKDDDSGAYTCGRKMHECAREFERCDTAKDCCDTAAVCVNSICTRLGPS